MKPLMIGTLTGSFAFVPLFIFNGLHSAIGGGLLLGYIAFEIAYFYRVNKQLHVNDPQKNMQEMNQKSWSLKRL